MSPASAQDLDDLGDLADEDDEDVDSAEGEDADDEDADDEGDEVEGGADGPEDDGEGDGEGAGFEAGFEAGGDAGSEADASDGRDLRVRFGFGLGGGTLEYERPKGLGTQVLDPSSFAAADGFLVLHFAPQSAFSLAARLDYRTSLGFGIDLMPLFGVPERVQARYQRGALTVAPRFQLGDDGPFSLAFPVGMTLQGLTLAVHQYTLEGFVVGGPTLGAELGVQWSDAVGLHVGPSAQWNVIIGSELEREGVCCQGFGVGGEAVLDLRVTRHLLAAIRYREEHTFAPLGSWRFQSVSRWLSAQLVGEM